jgi:4-aminobutyrate aminotransferase-like enzyme
MGQARKFWITIIPARRTWEDGKSHDNDRCQNFGRADRTRQKRSHAIYRYTDIAFERGEGSFLYDFEGKRYYDFVAGIATMSVGHNHPRVVAAIRDQAGKLLHGAAHVGYMQPYVEILEKLLSLAPSPIREGKGMLSNSGSEAVESAIKLARAVSGRSMVLAFMDAFHGRPMGALSLTASSSGYRKHLAPLLVGVEHVPTRLPSCLLDTAATLMIVVANGGIDPADLDRLVHPMTWQPSLGAYPWRGGTGPAR